MADSGGIGPRPDRVGTFPELLEEIERLRVSAARGREKRRLSLQDIAAGAGIPKSSLAGDRLVGLGDAQRRGVGSPAITSWGPDRLDLFVVDTGNRLKHRFWDARRWSGWEDLGGPAVGTPAAC